ncbi:MAG: substrate-binding domain-containing protein [Verrucomicrobiota bacterium]|nr:substrate-binding domain-containing protein [Verrucomicrobiota bacterium]
MTATKSLTADVARPCVLVLRMTFDDSSERLLRGINRFAVAADWDLRRIDFRGGLDGLVDLWRPVGILADAGLTDETLSAVPGLSGIPVVFCDLSPDAVGTGLASSACVESDTKAVVDAAFDELARQGLVHFGYVPFADRPCCSWSVARGVTFARRARASGATFSRFDSTEMTVARRMRELRTWLAALPKPCGVFAANDVEAERVRDVCAAANIGIPDEIALVGVDNRRDICESGAPTLTSVEQDFEACGFLSAQILGRMLAGEDVRGRAATFGITHVVRRASTRCLSVCDRHVMRALEFICRHAGERITSADVLAVMGCRRSYGYQRFRECLGHTILDEIRSRRIERVKELIRRGDRDLASLPDYCGFSSMTDLRRVFKAATGLTPAQWREKLRRT